MRRPMVRHMGIGWGASRGEGRELELRSTEGVGRDVWSGARVRSGVGRGTTDSPRGRPNRALRSGEEVWWLGHRTTT